MRPYVLEVAMVFAAGLCVGAWLNERRHMEEAMPDVQEMKEVAPAVDIPVKETKKKKGWFVSLNNGKLVIDPSGKKRFFFF